MIHPFRCQMMLDEQRFLPFARKHACQICQPGTEMPSHSLCRLTLLLNSLLRSTRDTRTTSPKTIMGLSNHPSRARRVVRISFWPSEPTTWVRIPPGPLLSIASDHGKFFNHRVSNPFEPWPGHGNKSPHYREKTIYWKSISPSSRRMI